MEHQFDIDPKLINELAKSIKSEKDLAALSKHLLKLTVERGMNTEMDDRVTKSTLLQAKIAAITVMVTLQRKLF